MIDIEQLYRDFNINYASEGHKHTRPGWVNTECPFCTGNPGLHLGFNTELEYYVCWRCGGHKTTNTVANLLKVSYSEAYLLLEKYKYGFRKTTHIHKTKPRLKSFKFPNPLMDLQSNHIKYLEKRGFDADELIKTWNIMATGPLAKLDELDYKHRIIIPFEWDGKIVSFDSRDITGKAINKYQACPKQRELIGHKSILYGKQEKWNKTTGICVEGPTDVWRLGVFSFAVSGIKYTLSQVRHITKRFERVFIIFDPDKQGQAQARQLSAELRFRNVDTHVINIPTDPGSMKQSDADYLIKTLIKH